MASFSPSVKPKINALMDERRKSAANSPAPKNIRLVRKEGQEGADGGEDEEEEE